MVDETKPDDHHQPTASAFPNIFANTIKQHSTTTNNNKNEPPEAKEAAVAGINWTFAPMVDITRDARWGRVMEGAGEDPY